MKSSWSAYAECKYYMIRVAQVIGKLAGGGVETVVNNYYRNTDSSCFEFDYFIDDDSNQLPPQEMIDRGARYIKVPSSSHVVRRILALEKSFKQNKYEIVHAHMNTLNVLALYAAWRAGVPIRISHNHSTGCKQEGKRNIAKLMLRMTGSWFATTRVACGEVAGRWFFGNRMFDSGRVIVLRNAIDISTYQFNSTNRETLRRCMNVTDKYVVGHVGRFAKQKNHEFILKVYSALLNYIPNAVLWLIGEGDRQDAIREMAEKKGLKDSVFFLGLRDDVAKLYSAMDCFVLPSFYEGVPLVGIEAQASGLPCFFSDGISKETALTDRTWFIPLAASADRWASAIADNMTLTEEQRTMAAKQICGSSFDLEQNGKDLERIYREALQI